jgi:hypothetical protein
MVVAVRTPETSVYYNETTQRSIPEGSNLQVIKPFYCLALQKWKWAYQITSLSRLSVCVTPR